MLKDPCWVQAGLADCLTPTAKEGCRWWQRARQAALCIFCLPHMSTAGKRVREENRSRLLPVSRGSRRALEWIDKEIPIKRLPAKYTSNKGN